MRYKLRAVNGFAHGATSIMRSGWKITLILFALLSAAQAQFFGGSCTDPFLLGENAGGNAGYSNTAGLTSRPLTYNGLARNLVLITAGQSNCAGVGPTLYVPTNSSVIDNFNIYDGNAYAISGPLLGTSYGPALGPGNVSARLADLFVTNGIFDHVLIVPICIGGSTAAQWATGDVVGTRFQTAFARLASRGIKPTTSSWTFVISWWHGESDSVGGTSQASYVASMNTILANVQAAGFNCATCRFFVNKQTYYQGASNATIQAARAQFISNNSTKVFAGRDIDTLTGPSNRTAIDGNGVADDTHLNDAGSAAAALLVYNAIHATGAPF